MNQNKIQAGIFAFGSVAPGQHRHYNQWHSFEHIPDNVAAPGLAFGARYVATPDLISARPQGDPTLSATQYLISYFIDGSPAKRIVDEHHALNHQLRQQGKDFSGDRTIHFISPFSYVAGYTAPRVNVAPESLLYRPHKGIYIAMADMSHPDDREIFQDWCEAIHFPDMLSPAGFAGLWRFVSYGGVYAGFENPRERFLHIYFLDEDPAVAVADLRAKSPSWRTPSRSLESHPRKVIFTGAFRTIHHEDEYRWFD